MLALDAGNWITLALAAAAALISWGMSRQKIADLERRISAQEGTRDEVIRLQEQVKMFAETLKEMRDDLRQALRQQPRRKAEVDA